MTDIIVTELQSADRARWGEPWRLYLYCPINYRATPAFKVVKT